MKMSRHPELHRNNRIGWLRAAVLGANDGIVSVAGLLVGMTSAHADQQTVLLAGVAGLSAGAMSMAAGEYVSVSSQADTERADRLREQQELVEFPKEELDELTRIYVARGLAPELARQCAVALTEHDALGAHLRDELGITDELTAQPLQAAVVSAFAFGVGALVPVLVAAFTPMGWSLIAIVSSTIASLVFLGGLSASVGGAPILTGSFRVAFWGVVAMAVTYAIGLLFGISVA
ncbi:VIT family protein [Rhodopirellula sp. SWK7]|uniref:VIT1/CCC1 transporter family protein n=1 Tax=Rhodopirellula sp. SWK7 TaxID=595460 RepID=UPI0002BFDB90|nr:VIT family protein [Rhodopirellula sp. SWK7]EMI45860.1 integral membrane protein [Rhodopirellula sp. SWK7]